MLTYKSTLAKIIFALLLLSFLQLQSQSNKFEPIDVFDLEYVSSPSISPDGKKILYVRNFKDIMTDKNFSNIWVINYDGSNNIPLTTGNQNHFDPTWSNLGDKFTYKSNLGGTVQLYLYQLDSKTNQKLTNVQTSIGKVDWSDDDKYLTFTSFVEKSSNRIIKMPKKPNGAKWNKPAVEISDIKYRSDGRGFLKQGYNQIFVLPVEGGTPRQVSFLENNSGSPKWKSNRQILFSANLNEDSDLEPTNSEIHLLDIYSNKVTQLTTRFGPDYSPVISPDRSKIAY